MLGLKKIIDFYIISNIHVAFAGFCLSKITLLKNNDLSNSIPLFVGFSIIVSYNFIRLYELKNNRLHWFKIWFKQNENLLKILIFLSIGSLLFIIFFNSFNFLSLFVLIPFAIMTVFYVIPLAKFKNTEFSFRYFPAIKIFSIAIAWAGITVLFPISEASIPINLDVFVEFFRRFLILLAITIPFDIRDLDLDIANLKTLPQMFGISNSKRIGFVALLLFVIIGLNSNDYLIVDAMISIVTAGLLMFSSKDKTRYYTSFWVESVPIIWLFLLILLS